MKLGVVSDVLADHTALELAWAHLALQSAGVVVCARDLVGHMHRPTSRPCDAGLVVNPGSVVSVPVVETSRPYAITTLSALIATGHGVDSGEVRVVERRD